MADHYAYCRELEYRIRELETENAYLQEVRHTAVPNKRGRTREIHRVSAQSGELYQAVVHAAVDGFVMVNQKGRLVEANDAYCRMVGYQRQALLQMNISDIDVMGTIIPDASPPLETPAPNGYRYVETRHRHKNGRLVDVEINFQYLDDQGGIWFSFVRDITEKKQIREAVQKSAAGYRDLVESAPMMYAVLEKQEEDVVLRDCNALFLASMGYTRSEIIGRAMSDFYTPGSRVKMYHEQNLKRVRENKFFITERELIRRDGEIIHTLLQAQPHIDCHGEFIGIRCMFTNISPQKRAQEQLRESDHLLTMILDGIHDPLIITDRNMRVLMMNPAAQTYARKACSQCLGQECHEIFKPGAGPCADCCVGKSLKSGRKKHFERAGLMDPNVMERVTVYPILEKGHHAWAAIIRISDITLARKMKKELVQADKMISLGILVSGVAHEINNPINLIMANTPLLIDAWKSIVPLLERYYRENGDFSLGGLPYSRMSTEIPQLFEGIIEGSVRIQQIVKDLKDYARKEDVNMDQDVDLNHVVKNAVRLNRTLILEKTAHFSQAYGNPLPMVRGNRQKLEQVVINLIQNACQAISDREQGLQITTFWEPDRNRICIRVKDQGDGIPENLLDRIMDPFFTTRRGQGGTGLGLSVSLNIVTTHGGKIDVTSKPGHGAVFTVSLPLNTVPDDGRGDPVPGGRIGAGLPEAVS